MKTFLTLYGVRLEYGRYPTLRLFCTGRYERKADVSLITTEVTIKLNITVLLCTMPQVVSDEPPSLLNLVLYERNAPAYR